MFQDRPKVEHHRLTRVMRILKRLTAALSSVLLLQLTLLEGGTVCVMHGNARAVVAGAAAPMPGMAHGGASRATIGDSRQPAAQTNGCDAGAASRSCPAPPNPAGCASMMTCAVAAVPPNGDPSALTSTRIAAVLSAPRSARVNPVFAPEPPPPRA